MKYCLFVMIVAGGAVALMAIDSFPYGSWWPVFSNLERVIISAMVMNGLYAMITHARRVRGPWGEIFWRDAAV